MSRRSDKHYVVWQGRRPGVYSSWAEAEKAVKGYVNAKYKAFPSKAAAERAFKEGPDKYWGTGKFVSKLSKKELAAIGPPPKQGIAVDAAWNAETKAMEYRGVWIGNHRVAFRQGPFPLGTNNLGEFLAIVHALGLLAERKLGDPVYSDSLTAISWVKKKTVKSRSQAEGKTGDKVNQLTARALAWLQENKYKNKVLKWETAAWGEIPADYGRK
jgi:ribonuclease HI